MQERDYLVILYDFYGELLTNRQKEYFEDYYFNNLSLSEISENLNISRNAIHKSLKNICDKLIDYEEKLQLYEKNIKLNEIINSISNQQLKDELKQLY